MVISRGNHLSCVFLQEDTHMFNINTFSELNGGLVSRGEQQNGGVALDSESILFHFILGHINFRKDQIITEREEFSHLLVFLFNVQAEFTVLRPT